MSHLLNTYYFCTIIKSKMGKLNQLKSGTIEYLTKEPEIQSNHPTTANC